MVSDCEELVGVTWSLSDCEELSGGFLTGDDGSDFAKSISVLRIIINLIINTHTK